MRVGAEEAHEATEEERNDELYRSIDAACRCERRALLRHPPARQQELASVWCVWNLHVHYQLDFTKKKCGACLPRSDVLRTAVSAVVNDCALSGVPFMHNLCPYRKPRTAATHPSRC